MGECISEQEETVSRASYGPGISLAMALAGIAALSEWEDKKTAGQDVSEGDLVAAIFSAMTRESQR
jgi:hypothetical protein